MKTLLQSIKITIVFCLIFFTGYVLVLCLFSSVFAPNGGQAETLTLDSKIVGAANVGQNFSDSTHFWGRPSAANYDGSASGASNKGAINPDYLADVNARIDAFLVAHPYLNRQDVPSMMVTASGSGLDPHISIESARVQVRRVAQARQMNEELVAKIVEQNIERPLVGQPVINVLKLNIALDEK